MLRAIVASRNFNPGHYSHLVGNYKLLSEHGMDTFMYQHTLFNKMNCIDQSKVINNIAQLKRVGKIDSAIFWFPSLKNIFDIIFLRILYKTIIVYVFHEPLESASIYRHAGFGFFKVFRIFLIGQINFLLVLLSNKVILPSEKAYLAFEANYSCTKKKYALIPLLFDDEAQQINTKNERSFISYIGTIADDHAFDEFVNFVKLASINNWFPQYTFLIATKSVVPVSQLRMLSSFIAARRVVIYEGNAMSNEEINSHFNNSVVVWNAYRRSMQSGVLPKAFMFGTPLIASACNANDFFENYKNGVIVSGTYDVKELKLSIELIINNFDKYSSCCREKFLSTFFYKAHKKKFVDFISDI